MSREVYPIYPPFDAGIGVHAFVRSDLAALGMIPVRAAWLSPGEWASGAVRESLAGLTMVVLGVGPTATEARS